MSRTPRGLRRIADPVALSADPVPFPWIGDPDQLIELEPLVRGIGVRHLDFWTIVKLWGCLLRYAEECAAEGCVLVAPNLQHLWVEVTVGDDAPLGRTLDTLPGSLWIRFPDAVGALVCCGEPAADELRMHRLVAPELRAGEPAHPSAAVHMAARVALHLWTELPVTTSEQLPAVVAAIRLWLPQLHPALQVLLEQSLAADPAHRPADPATALTGLAEATATARASVRWRRPDGVVCLRDRAVGWGKSWSLRAGFMRVEHAQEDELLWMQTGAAAVAAVFDGVSTTDVGAGWEAPALAREAFTRHFEAHPIDVPADPTAANVDGLLRTAAIEAFRAAAIAVSCELTTQYGESRRAGRRTPVTTATLALVLGSRALVAWVGDSPAFLVWRGGAARLVAAHSKVNLTMRMEHSYAAMGDDDHHALMAVLGEILEDDEIQLHVDLIGFELDAGSLLVLGSDGVFDPLGADEAERTRFLAAAGARALVRHRDEDIGQFFREVWRAAVPDAKDNLTLMVLGVEPSGEIGPEVDVPDNESPHVERISIVRRAQERGAPSEAAVFEEPLECRSSATSGRSVSASDAAAGEEQLESPQVTTGGAQAKSTGGFNVEAPLESPPPTSAKTADNRRPSRSTPSTSKQRRRRNV